MTITQSGSKLAKYIDHTFLKPEASFSDIDKICQEAITYNFCAVCIPPSYVFHAKEKLKNTNIKVCTVIGFPLGYSETQTKAFEAQLAIEHGADEIDMVINVGKLKDKKYEFVKEDILAVVKASDKKTVKVIIETSLLTDEEKIKACELIEKAGAQFAKTSTGFSSSGATVKDIKLMRSNLSDNIQIKASAGIRSHQDAIELIEAGATRLGTSSGVKLVQGLEASGGY